MSDNYNAFPTDENSESDRPEESLTPPSPLEGLGGYDTVREGVAYLSGLMQGDEPGICVVVVDGVSIQPFGLPSMLLGPSEHASDVYDTAKQMVAAAIFRGKSAGAIANLHTGKAAVVNSRTFLIH